ncbi:uncharacterized protein F5147DRAFT_723321 [Suillus discolor]|uniref:Uncharacterized protein n=1 Tax=Suillus discolor TaxID=1912936 RepID=A0A9P7EUE4_9AGAM|nr:uncharacterized protein F5147DRAFT_723321 [Suillus discolor]KAG2091651.1 hypothetical protein F5147DRAFT_723321 [Suillus discolor]
MQPNFVVQPRNLLTIGTLLMAASHCDAPPYSPTQHLSSSPTNNSSVLSIRACHHTLSIGKTRDCACTALTIFNNVRAVLETSFDILLDAEDVEHGRGRLWRDCGCLSLGCRDTLVRHGPHSSLQPKLLRRRLCCLLHSIPSSPQLATPSH